MSLAHLAWAATDKHRGFGMGGSAGRLWQSMNTMTIHYPWGFGSMTNYNPTPSDLGRVSKRTFDVPRNLSLEAEALRSHPMRITGNFGPFASPDSPTLQRATFTPREAIGYDGGVTPNLRSGLRTRTSAKSSAFLAEPAWSGAGFSRGRAGRFMAGAGAGLFAMNRALAAWDSARYHDPVGVAWNATLAAGAGYASYHLLNTKNAISNAMVTKAKMGIIHAASNPRINNLANKASAILGNLSKWVHG